MLTNFHKNKILYNPSFNTLSGPVSLKNYIIKCNNDYANRKKKEIMSFKKFESSNSNIILNPFYYNFYGLIFFLSMSRLGYTFLRFKN
jgi:hypothetical protein